METEKSEAMKKVKVENMKSNRGYRDVANQFIITDGTGVYFQSYKSVIAYKPFNGGKVLLDKDTWDYSTTTGKYRNQFLGEEKKDTEKKIKSGEYILTNLN